MIPITTTESLPSIYVQSIDRDIPDCVVCFWCGEQREPELRRDLTVGERSALEGRAIELRRAVAPAPASSRNMLLAAINGMLGAFPMMQRYDRAAAMAMAAAYLWTARNRPHWAIVKACVQVRASADGLNPSFCPSEPEFNALVGKLVADYARRLAATEELLVARISPPAAAKLSREALETRLGRPIPGRDTKPQKVRMDWDGHHLERVMADLAARKAGRPTTEGRT